MKKVLSIVSACLVLACVVVMAIAPVSAATPKEDIIAKAKELIPAAYQAEYLPLIENTLKQVEVTAEQAASVIKNMETAKAAVKEDKGNSLSNYPMDEQKVVTTEMQAACETLGLVMEVKPLPEEKADHEGDVEVIIKKKDENKVVSNIDFDVKKTDSAVDYTMIVAAAGLAIVAAVSAVYGKKLVASR